MLRNKQIDFKKRKISHFFLKLIKDVSLKMKLSLLPRERSEVAQDDYKWGKY